MQTPKARNGSVEVSQRTSPSTQSSLKSSGSTNRTARQLKVTGLASDSTASPNSSGRTPRNRSPKVLERGSPRSPMTQKKRPTKLSELESQLAQLENELKRVKDQLDSSETLRQCALKETEETRKQLVATSARLEESQQQLEEISTLEDDRVKELRKLSQERDRVWQSELEAIQKQHSMDSAALASSLNEIQRLKRQHEMVADSEATKSRRADIAYAEIESLRTELSETVSLVENMRTQLSECRGSEEHALQEAREAQMQLQEAMTTADTLRSEGLQAKEACNSLTLELEKSKEKASSLEILVKELKSEKNSLDISGEMMPKQDHGGNEQEKAKAIQFKEEIDSLKIEVSQLKSALDASELRYQDEYIRSTLEIRNAFDQVEREKSESGAREAQLEAELKKATSTVDELKSELSLKETMIHKISADNRNLLAEVEEEDPCPQKIDFDTELKRLKGDLQDLKAVLLDKENHIQNILEENAMLKTKLQMRETEKTQAHEEAAASAEAAKAAEREALMKLGCVAEEADKSSRKAARVTEQLDAAQTTNAELEAELRRLKVQSDQWRKAAEAAAAIISQGNNGKFVDRTVSLDNNYNTISTRMDSPLSDEIDDDSPKKKNGNMLKKFGVLWKKGQK